MHQILSPAEELGLSGAALDSRIRNATHQIADTTLARITEKLAADALANEVFYEHNGIREPVRIMPRPLLAQRDQLTYIHHVCLRITEALSRLPALFLDEREIREIVAVSGEEERWLREIWTTDHGRNNAVYGRLDAVCDFTSSNWRDTLQFMEPNLSGVGGIHYAPIAEQLVMRDVVPTLIAHDPELVIELPPDQRDLFVQVLIDHSRAIGRDACQLCFIEPKYEGDGPDEQAALRRYLSERHGLKIAHADPRELVVHDGEVYHEDLRIDVAYRDYEIRDLITLERELGRQLDGIRLLFRENRIISSLVGDFDHKSGFEILTDKCLVERYFSLDDSRLFQKHVLWTRMLSDRHTSLPDGSSGDLLEFVRQQREQLVLKPNRSYGGQGVTVGAATYARDWDGFVDHALASATDPDKCWVVQLATTLPVVEFPVVTPNRRMHVEPFYAVMGFAASNNGLGVLCRASQKQVVNVAQHGGIAALLVGETPKNLRIPKRSLHAREGVMAALRSEVAELRHLDQMIALLEWDEEVMQLAHGHCQRGEQVATLEGLRHAALTSDYLGDLIEDVAIESDRGVDLAREIELLRRERRRAISLPRELVCHLASAKSQALAAWQSARNANEFDIFASPFSQLLTLVREWARCLATDMETYDVLLDEHEPGMTKSRLTPLFDEIREFLVPLVQNTSHMTAQTESQTGTLRFPEVGQWELSRRILRAIGFDFARGRLDASTHPFTILAGDDDVRITGRVDERNFWSMILTTLHEGGHALYDQGFRPKDRNTLLADSASSGMHEGQARLWENHIGRSRAFLEFLSPHLLEIFPNIGDKEEIAQLWRELNAVRPGTLRVGADELTYHLHILLRYEIERALLAGDLAVSDIPHHWNVRSRALIGVYPRNPREGVLQDVHWAVGMFGYFPTYTIGSVYAAQLMKSYSQGHDFDAEVSAGHFTSLREWLRTNIYEVGNRHSAEKLMVSVTGRGLDTSAFFEYATSSDRSWNK